MWGASLPPLPHPPVLIGIVSDTHGFLHPDLARTFDGADLILHAGDVGGPRGAESVLDALRDVAPVRAVFGNADGPEMRRDLPEHERFEAGGLRFWMTHIGGRPGRWEKGIGPQLREDTPDVFVTGHSHILRVERVARLGGMLFVNPGAAGRQGFHQVKTCLRLRVDDGKAHQAEVVELP